MKSLVAILVTMVSITVLAAIRVGDNLLANPIFESDQLEIPGCWNLTAGREVYVWSANGGPQAVPAVTFDASRTNGVASFSLRQGGFRLLPGGRYRISCWIKASDFQCRRGGILVANTGWRWSAGVRLDSFSGGWKRFSEEFVAEPSSDGSWFAILFADSFSGRIELADVLLMPLDEETAAGTRFSDKAEAVESPRLVPVDLLHSIPSSRRTVSFRYFGRLDGGEESDYDVRVEIGGKASARKLIRGKTTVPLPTGEDGGEMTASVVRRKDGTAIFSRRYSCHVVDVPANPTCGTRLNGLVEEYVRRRLKPGGSGAIRLAFDRNVWLYVSADAESVEFDGREVIGPDVPDHEAFVEASVGEHRLFVRNAKGGELIVRRIPEILDYMVGKNDLREYARRSLTTLCCGGVAADDLAWFKKSGRVWIGNVMTSELKGSAELAQIIDGSKYVATNAYDGVSCDEQGPWKAKMMSDYAKGLWEYSGRPNFRVYSWVVGKPFYAASNADMLSATVNGSGGRGRFMNEIYCIAKPTEEETRKAARDWMVGNYRAWRELLPLARHGYAPIFGAFVQMRNGGWTLSPYSDVDFRYVLDLVFNVLVNEPEMMDVPMTGVWGSNYSGPELKRWTFRLFRHYLVEGRRTMLSDECGITFRPGHIRDCDFAAGAGNWRTAGDVRFDRIRGFGDKFEFRGGRQKLEVGDTFAVLRKTGGVAAEVSQKATGLAPGRRYRLEFKSFFVTDARSGASACRPTGVRARISDAENVKALPLPSNAKVNWHEVFFTAKGQKAEIVLTTADSPADEDVGVNCVGLLSVLED